MKRKSTTAFLSAAFRRRRRPGMPGRLPLVSAVSLLLCAGAAAQPGQSPPTGLWYDDTGQGAIEIAPCGERLCGRIVWLKNPTDKTGRPVTDSLNPEPQRRQRAFSIFYTGTIGAGAISPAIYGVLGDAVGVPTALMVVAAIVLVTLPITLILRPALPK